MPESSSFKPRKRSRKPSRPSLRYCNLDRFLESTCPALPAHLLPKVPSNCFCFYFSRHCFLFDSSFLFHFPVQIFCLTAFSVDFSRQSCSWVPLILASVRNYLILPSKLSASPSIISIDFQFRQSCAWESCCCHDQHDASPLPFFILGDLWDQYHEWSAYGAGVPITLHGQDTVVQYYVPYISALQLYTRSKTRPSSARFRIRQSSDAASDSDYGDFANEACTDSDPDTVPDCRNCQCGNSHRLDAVIGCECECGKFNRACNAWSDSEDDQGEEISRDWNGHLLFEYFESSPPHARVPLVDKIWQLAARVPELRSLRSVDLLPASWMSIAWYPIYRIPIGPTLRDLEACFLTYHCVSTSLKDGEPSGIVKPISRPTDCAITLSSHCDPTIHLQAFGLAHYKLRGSIWTSAGNPERKHAASLYRCAESWLKRLHVQHPDFEFFRSHNPISTS